MFGFFKNAKLKKLEVLSTTRGDTGGLFKRIDENRELLEVLFRDAPGFMQSHPWVEGWIKGNDAFFEGVRSTLELELHELHPTLAGRVPRAWPRPLAAWPPRLSERAAGEPNPQWKAHAYPLQQVVIKLQGTRQSSRTAVVSQLEIVRSRLQVGEAKGSDHDDDFGYTFEYGPSVDGPSFFAEPAGGSPTGGSGLSIEEVVKPFLDELVRLDQEDAKSITAVQLPCTALPVKPRQG